MKKIKIIFITPLVLSLMSFQKNSQPLIYEKEIIVSIDDSSDLTNKTKFIDFLNLNSIEYKSLDNLSENEYSKYYCFNFNNEKEYTTAFNNLKKIKEVIYVEENKIIYREENIENNVTSINNIQLSNSVNLKKPYELIQSEKAKELPGENNKINVAIIDAPVELNSPILKTKFDKTYSKKFNQNDSDKVNSERIFHGCAVSYIIGGTSNNSDYASGICENVNIIALTIPNIAEISDFVKIMNYLNNLPIDVPITNCSYSMGTDNSDIMKQSIMDYKGLFVCAASNDKINLDNPKNEVFPAMYSLNNMIVVGESNINDIKTERSNYGKSNVDIFAPGHYIYSINEYDEFIPVEGTSFAAPLVTGTCALMLSKDSSLSLSEVKAKVMSYADKIDTLKDYCVDGNRLNVFSAVYRDNHQNTYLWQNTKKHLSTCTICNKQELEGHIVSGSMVIGNKRYSTCLLCKGEAEFGFAVETCALNSIDEYDFIDGLFYPKKTQIIDGILDLSYEDSLKYEKN